MNGLRHLFFFVLCFAGPLLLLAQPSQKQLQAIRIAEPIKLDGQLEEAAWVNAPMASGFIKSYPNTGTPSDYETFVKVLYDDNAIYIGAFLKDDPKLVRKQLTNRDREQRQDVDFFSVFLDTYDDNQNAFQFTVTSRNVQSDARHSATTGGNAFGSGGDYSWDAVWDSRVTIQNNGWYVEMKLPYMALRFAKKPIQQWGIEFQRNTRRTNENAYWSLIDPQVNGFVNQFAHLTGLTNIVPPLRLNFLPYVTAGMRSTPQEDGSFQTESIRNGGMDVKWGVNESFTLDATLIPDFGQVVSDNVVLNLSPFEIQFQENRPFFTEGTELFNKAGIFYSRRVGGTPGKYFSVAGLENEGYDVIENPSVIQLYNATKFSGRNKNNLGIGVFNAVTAQTTAKVRNKTTGADSIIVTEPLANYNLFVLDQVFKNRSYVTFTNTNVLREGEGRDANVSALDVALFDKTNTYSLVVNGRYSNVKKVGDNHDGFKSTIFASKISGLWQYSIGNNIESERYDPNDLGFIRAPNEFSNFASISYNQFNPTKRLLSYQYELNLENNNLLVPFVYNQLELNTNASFVFKNFWDVRWVINSSMTEEKDYFELRTPGRYMKKVPYLYSGIYGSTDSRKKFFMAFGGGFAQSRLPNDPYFNLNNTIRYRFSDRITLSLENSIESDRGNYGYAFMREADGEPIIGRRKILTVSNILNGVYNFTPRMNLTFRARHFWSNVTYNEYFNVGADGWYIPRPFIAGNDENFNVFNIDMFYTWDFRLGSRIIFAWKNWLGNSNAVDGMRYNKYMNNLGQVFANPHGNELTLRFIYFLDYSQFKRRDKRSYQEKLTSY